MKALAAAALGLRWSGIRVMLWLCYGCHASQERINISAVPTAPRDSFQILSLHLAYPGFHEQCRQCEEDQRETRKTEFFTFHAFEGLTFFFTSFLIKSIILLCK